MSAFKNTILVSVSYNVTWEVKHHVLGDLYLGVFKAGKALLDKIACRLSRFSCVQLLTTLADQSPGLCPFSLPSQWW